MSFNHKREMNLVFNHARDQDPSFNLSRDPDLGLNCGQNPEKSGSATLAFCTVLRCILRNSRTNNLYKKRDIEIKFLESIQILRFFIIFSEIGSR